MGEGVVFSESPHHILDYNWQQSTGLQQQARLARFQPVTCIHALHGTGIHLHAPLLQQGLDLWIRVAVCPPMMLGFYAGVS